MPGIIARGRIAWILAIVLGVALIVVGAVTTSYWAIGTGSGFALFGVIFLILSFVTRGRTD
jgi:hypothetical protein